jgi:hypothetical protein
MMKLLNAVCNTHKEREEGRGTRNMQANWKVCLYKGNPTTLRQVHHFPTSHLTFYLFNDSIPIDLALKEDPNGRPRYFKGKEETPQPRMLANPFTFSTLPTWTISN